MNIYLKCLFLIGVLVNSSFALAELVAVDDEKLMEISGQSGITINAKVVLGADSDFIYTNTSGKSKADASAAETSYLIVNGIEGELEILGLKLDLISDLNNSGKSAFQWTMPKKIIATNLKTSGIYASTSKEVASGTTSTFLTSVNMNGTLLLPAKTTLSVFVAN
ncbi:MAG: DUF6160 family protein [Shewanella psychromarinicola]|jgi:hypothetical protein|uniref:DUF6160 family protein n=1 Tax=Shewanella psychromarinicola TaxID=2487742 RepID=UPI0030026CD0